MDLSSPIAILREIIALKELKARETRLRARYAVRIKREPAAVAEVNAMRLDHAARSEYVWQAAEELISRQAPAHPPEVQAALDRVATLPLTELPTYVTKQAQNDDGSPKVGPDGRVILLHQDGTPLSVVERAIVDRFYELHGRGR